MQTDAVKLYTFAYKEGKTYWVALLFVLGNVLFPQLCHLFNLGGPTWLPIYFFTLIGAYKYGWQVGLLTAGGFAAVQFGALWHAGGRCLACDHGKIGIIGPGGWVYGPSLSESVIGLDRCGCFGLSGCRNVRRMGVGPAAFPPRCRMYASVCPVCSCNGSVGGP